MLSDSDFGTFYENLNLTSNIYTLNEKELLDVSTKLLKLEQPIIDEHMKKYSFSEVSIIKMIIKEIYKCLSNPNIHIEPNNFNIFDLDVILTKECWDSTSILTGTDVHLNIKLPKLYYPYFPPQITIQSPKFTDIFLSSINTLDYLKQEFWNPSNTLFHTLEGLIKIFSQHAQLDNTEIHQININNQVIQLWSILGIKTERIDFKIDFIKLSNETSTDFNSKSLMASGIGYGNESYTKFDMKKFLADKKNKTQDIIKNLELINSQLEINCDKITIDLIQSKLAGIIYYYLFDVNILEITNKLKEYELVIEILEKFSNIELKNIQTGSDNLEKLVKQLGTTIDDYIKLSTSDKEICSLGLRVTNLYKKYQIDHILTQEKSSILANHLSTYDDLKELQFESANIKNLCSKLQKIESLSPDSQKRIMREFSSLKKSLPFNYETSVFFRYDDVSMNKMKFLITGPKDTPYQDGCFVFDMILPSDYPTSCPKVQIVTTGKGSVRFNPNLYSCGKVCLSLLGTWPGRPEEGWNNNSTMLQLFVSIQSLIFIDHPYFNEPGYQLLYGTSHGMATSAQYNADIQANNIKWAIIDSIINPEPCFVDVITTHFKFKKDNILSMALEWAKTNNLVKSQLETLKSVLAKL